MATRKTTKATKAVSNTERKARKAPGNAKALHDKANDNLAKQRKQAGHAEAVAKVLTVRSGSGVLIETTRGRNIVISREDGRTRKLAVVGLPVQPLEEYLKTQPKPIAQMARGTDAHVAPHSAKAVADQKRSAKAAPKAAAKAGKNKQPARGTDRDYTVGKTEVTAKADSWRGYMLATIRKHTNTAKAKAAHEKSGKFSSNKLDFNWAAAQDYISWVK